MTHTLHTQQNQLDEILVAAAGRFGRQLRTIAWPDPEAAPARTTTVARMRARMIRADYRIDPSVVASAIVDRVYL